MKWEDLDSLSQTTHMTVWPKDEDKWVIKSVVNYFQSLAGIGIGLSNPKCFLLLGLFCWQGRHYLMYVFVSRYILGQ